MNRVTNGQAKEQLQEADARLRNRSKDFMNILQIIHGSGRLTKMTVRKA